MKTILIVLGVIGLIVLMIFGSVVGMYNDLVTRRNVVTTHWSQVETQYQRRFDLIPNLAEATKGYLIHEQEIFMAIATARSKYGSTISDVDKMNNIKIVDQGLAKILVAIENYPNLKANETVKSLMDELAGTENRISVARQRYNEVTNMYNTAIQVFPTNLIAGYFHFESKPLFVSETGAEKAVKINLDTKGLVQ